MNNLFLQTIEPLLREQFMLQMQRHERMLEVLENSGFLGSASMLASEHKEKLGLLDMFQPEETHAKRMWKTLYFIIQDGVLYWFIDSKVPCTNVSANQKPLPPFTFVISISGNIVKTISIPIVISYGFS